MKSLLSVILLSLFLFSGCGGGGGGSTAPVDNTGGDGTSTSTVDPKYYGAWKYADDGSEEYITSKTTLNITPVNDDLLSVNVNGTTKHLIRDGLRNVTISGNVEGISSDVSRSLRAGNIGGMNVVLSNIKDNNIKATPIVDTNGKFTDNTLPSGTYEISGSKDGLSFTSQVELSDENTDLGAFTAVDTTLHNYKTELTMTDDFIYADGNTYNGNIRVKNISQVDGIGLNYTITLTDDKLKSFSYDTVLGTIPAGSYKDIPIRLSFNTIDLNEKTATITTKIKDVNNNEWNDASSFKIYKEKLRLNFSSQQSTIRGYVTLPNKKQKTINFSNGYIEVPSLVNEDYFIILSNPDLSKETSYSIGYATTTVSLTNFSDTSAYESQNSSKDGAVEIVKSSNVSAYLHVGDIDFYKIRTQNSLFQTILDAPLNSTQISNEITITDEILKYGNQVIIDNGSLIVNNIGVGKNAIVQLGDKLKISLVSSEIFATTTNSNLGIGPLNTSFSITTSQEDTAIDLFNFTNITNAIPSTSYTSNNITISGINKEANVISTLGTIVKNGIDVGVSTTVKNGDIINVKLTSSSLYGSTISSIVTIGSLSKTFSITNVIGLENKTYNLAAYSTMFYYLTMPLSGKLDIDTSYPTEVTIYDEFMNIINNEGYSDRTVSLNKQTYIVKITANHSPQPVTFYSPVLDTKNNFFQLENKTYNLAAYSTMFYYLTMPLSGKLDIDTSYPTEVTIYDEFMNIINNEGYSDRTVSLNKQTYIVKITANHSPQPVTFYSLQLK